MNYGKIGVILGGRSAEREISLSSGRAIYQALAERGHRVVKIGEDGPIEDTLLAAKIDVAFIALHGRYGEDGTFQRFLEDKQIPYTGSRPLASKQALDKAAAKEIFKEKGIPTPEYLLVDLGISAIEHLEKELSGKINFPVVLKPVDEGSSIGLSIVRTLTELKPAVERALGYSSRLLIEKYISGREITVGILAGAPLPVVEIIPRQGHYSFQAKYTKGMSDYFVPADLSPAVYREVQLIALKAHQALGCSDFSRVDLRVDPDNRPWVLEVNTIPGFTPSSLLPKAAQAVGIGFGDLCEQILALARRRFSGAELIF